MTKRDELYEIADDIEFSLLPAVKRNAWRQYERGDKKAVKSIQSRLVRLIEDTTVPDVEEGDDEPT